MSRLRLKPPENLDIKCDEAARVKPALEINRPLTAAYCLKEDRRQSWAQSARTFAEAFLDDWVRRAEASGIRMLRPTARPLECRRSDLPAYYDHPISTCLSEEKSNKIRNMKRQSNEIRDQKLFKLNIVQSTRLSTLRSEESFYDFHSPRCQTATPLDAEGATPRVAHRVMRRGTPGSNDRYMRLCVSDVNASLPVPSLLPDSEPSRASNLAAAGTVGQN